MDGTLGLAHSKGNHGENRHLTSESLRRGDTNLRSHMDIGTCVRSPRNRRADSIADAIDEGTFLLGQLYSCQSIGCLTTLGDGHYDIILTHDRITVTELAGILHLDGDTHQRLDNLLANQTSMPRCTTGHNDHTLGTEHLTAIVNQCRECHMIGLDIHAPSHAVGQTLWLLEDLLEHKVGITTLLNLSEVNIDGLYCQLLLFTKDAHDLQILTTTDHSDITILEIHHLIGILHDRAGIRTQEELVVTDTYHQRTLLTGSDNLIRIAFVEHSDGVCANHLIESHLNSRQKVELLMFLDILNKLHQHLSIRIRNEGHTFGLEFLFQFCIVLNDTVMDDSQIMALGIVGMGIARRRLTMSGPACMGNTDMTTYILIVTIVAKIIDLAFRFIDIQLACAIDHSHTSTVVTTIFQTAQALDQDRESILISDITNYSTHT